MADHQINAPDSSQPEPLMLKDFASSLYHAGRADNFFKFLKNFSDEDLANFLQGLLRQVGDAIDDGSIDALASFVEQGQVAAYVPTQTPAPFRPDFPDAPFAPLRSLHSASRFGKPPSASFLNASYLLRRRKSACWKRQTTLLPWRRSMHRHIIWRDDNEFPRYLCS